MKQSDHPADRQILPILVLVERSEGCLERCPINRPGRLVQQPEGIQYLRQTEQGILYLRSGVVVGHRRSLRRGCPDLTEPLTEYCLHILSVDFAFSGADAIGAESKVYNLDLRLAKVDRMMRMYCLPADRTRRGTPAFAQNVTFGDYDVFITGPRIGRQILRRLQRGDLQAVTVTLGPENRN